jgi:hypothetical protein
MKTMWHRVLFFKYLETDTWVKFLCCNTTLPSGFSCLCLMAHSHMCLEAIYGCVRLLVRTILFWFGPVCSKQTVRAVPVPLCGSILLDSSTVNHVKNGSVLNKRLRPGPTIERSDPIHTNKRMFSVPVRTSPYQ